MSRVWSKFDEKGLARFVVPDAIRWVRLPVNRADLMRHSEGRRRLIEAIYTVLLDRQTRSWPSR
jgi:hypothetical protein